MSSSELANATLSLTNVTLFRANKLIFKNLNLNISSGDICNLAKNRTVSVYTSSSVPTSESQYKLRMYNSKGIALQELE